MLNCRWCKTWSTIKIIIKSVDVLVVRQTNYGPYNTEVIINYTNAIILDEADQLMDLGFTSYKKNST